jgi:hypothetical protein
MQPQQNDFNFILDSSQNQTGGPAFLQDPKKRNIIAVLFVGGVLLLVMLIIIIISSLTSKNTASLVDVAVLQNEIVRITKLGLADASDPAVRVKVSTIGAFMQSDFTKTSSFLASNGRELDPEALALTQDTAVDESLESAALRNNFDETLLDEIDKKSASYKVALQKAINEASSESEKNLLNTAASNIIIYEQTQENSGVLESFDVTRL